jgi:hypothetical protein
MKLISVISLGFALVSTFPDATALPLRFLPGFQVKPGTGIVKPFPPHRCHLKRAPCGGGTGVFKPAIFIRDDELAVAARTPQDEALETALENLILENIESRDISVAAREVEDLEMREPISPALIGAGITLAPYAIKGIKHATPHVVSAVKQVAPKVVSTVKNVATKAVSAVKNFFGSIFRREGDVDDLIANWVANELASRSLPVLSARADEDSDADALVNDLVRTLQIVARGFEI